MSRVYIIILNWNGWRDTVECLESIFCSDSPDFRVVVCDNGSTDDSIDRIKAWATGELPPSKVATSPLGSSDHQLTKPLECKEYVRLEAESGGDLSSDPPLVLIRNEANLGFAGGNNVGIQYAQARNDFAYVWLLNNDTVIENHALSALVKRMGEKPDAGMCGSTIRFYERPDKVQALGGGWHCKWIGLPWHYGRFGTGAGVFDSRRAEKWMNYVEGASLLVSKQFLEEIGLMCEDYFLFFEETDWAIRARRRYSLAYAPHSIVYHKVGASIGTSSKPWEKSYCCDYFNIRNRLFFTKKFFPYAFPTVYLVIIAALLVRVLLGRWDRVRMIIRLLAGQYTMISAQVQPTNSNRFYRE